MISFHRFVELMNESDDWMPDKNTNSYNVKYANMGQDMLCPKCDGAIEKRGSGGRGEVQYVCPRCKIVVEVPQKGSSSNMPLGSRTWQIPSDSNYRATINPGDANRIGGL